MNTAGQGSGQAKIILLGEHAVVYGQPALAGALDRGIRARACPGGGPLVRVPAWDLQATPAAAASPSETDDSFGRVLHLLFSSSRPCCQNAEVVVEPEVPSRAGLGSSAAFAVAVGRALADLAGEPLSLSALELLVDQTETVFHGRPSGIDAAVASRGGILRFVKGAAPCCLEGPSIPVVVAQAQPRAPTRDMVARVAQARERQPERVNRIFSDIGHLVTDGVSAVETGQWDQLGRLMDENQGLLQELELSTPLLDAACAAARRAGALGAKLTGAGGGGCLVALAPGRQDAVVEALRPLVPWVVVGQLGTSQRKVWNGGL